MNFRFRRVCLVRVSIAIKISSLIPFSVLRGETYVESYTSMIAPRFRALFALQIGSQFKFHVPGTM